MTKSSTFARMSRKRTISVALAGVIAASGVAVSSQVGASAANAGTVMCANEVDVVGVWVDVSGGASGWAARRGSGYSQTWNYNTQGRPYSLTVGCGGSPSKWATTSSTPSFATTWSNVVCYPGWAYGVGGVYAHDRCYAG